MDYERPRLLLVQHNQQTADITSFRLQLLGYDVVSLKRGEDVPQSVELQLPDLLLVESRLPGIDGFEVTSRLRANERTAAIPVLICSPDSSRESVRNAFSAGADDYLIMPFDPATLENKVESLLANGRVVAVQE
ncbi:response regulator [Fuerstiella marisgermanici]|uniref:Alkaline phosphatase synthesis transcriptional regulatory protein PhoP n=1 Tax=Fuerstiella marisgermanici TaxID=1891926 RepID=A0A1P8WKX8_9PLAN|nr:response regulator [Fuerstiella marisgermanici]APZ94722.1 Alkaline phosphatase synthesis transcriptional regulatory protein PhoP [Fuerstiella marisgermanici]